MDTAQYSTLLDALIQVPDPRHARGQRHPWPHLLLIIAAGLASNHQSARALAQWAQLHAATLQAMLPKLRRLPSASMILHALRCMDVHRLEHYLAQLAIAQPAVLDDGAAAAAPPRSHVQGQAVDGKWVRTATAHGARTLLLSIVQHGTGRTLAQTKVAAHQTEVRACQHLLCGRKLTSTGDHDGCRLDASWTSTPNSHARRAVSDGCEAESPPRCGTRSRCSLPSPVCRRMRMSAMTAPPA